MRQGYSVTPSPSADELLLVPHLMYPGRLREALLGYYYPQALTSALVSLIAAPRPGELVCDLCAAPGSKTSHMAQLMDNQGTIVANEPANTRLACWNIT
jgi:16S rRNA C967 or C1407 C5-methylase (RsmB/RsmF family)